MVKTREFISPVFARKSRMSFEQAKVHFTYAFSLSGWRERTENLAKLRRNNGTPDVPQQCELVSFHEKEYEQIRFIVDRLKQNADPSYFRRIEVCPTDDRGSRPYLLRSDPFIDIEFAEEVLVPRNRHAISGLMKILTDKSIRFTPVMRLYLSGFGVLRLKADFLTAAGEDCAIREIVHSTDDSRGCFDNTEADMLINQLAKLLSDNEWGAPAARREDGLLSVEDIDKRRRINDRFVALARRRNKITSPLLPETITEITNLDRGQSPLNQPKFTWGGNSHPQALYAYFAHMIDDILLRPLSKVFEGIDAQKPLRLDDAWHAEEGQYPYVSIFLPYYDRDSYEPFLPANIAAAFRSRISAERADLARIMLRTNWALVRDDWPPIAESLDNVFYSDLIHIGVHLRSTLCYYCLPNSRQGFAEMPEFRSSHKYREELSNIIGDQRLLWYAYNRFNDRVSEEIAVFSQKFDELMAHVEAEKYELVVKGLNELVQGIDQCKTEIAGMMVDPQSRKGGSSLFTDVLERTTNCFHLPELYKNLRHKLDRLDMLGLHVSEALHECSNLRVAEGTRSTQLTLEFLEAFILGVYTAEITHFMAGAYEAAHAVGELAEAVKGHEIHGAGYPVPLGEWWSFYAIALGTFLAALPWLTQIRKSFARFELREPAWFNGLIKFGSVSGPIILSVLTYQAINAHVKNAAVPLLSGLVALVCVVLIAGWWSLERRHKGSKH